MQLTIAFALLFSLRTISLAEDVAVYYNYLDYYTAEPGTEPKPTAVSQFPWEFSFPSGGWFGMYICLKNKSPGVTAVNFTYTNEFGTFLAENDIVRSGPRKGEEYYYVSIDFLFTEIEIALNLYSSNISCSPLLVAKGRKVTNIPNETPMKEFRYIGPRNDLLVVDLLDKCDDTLVTERNMQPTTVRIVTDLKKLNNTLIVPTSSHVNLETTGSDTRAKSINIIFIIVGSLSGVTFTLLAVIAIRKRCWIKHSPRGTADLPTNQNHQPFYVNLLFGRQCALEIAEIDQHVYEEIHPPVSEDQHVYEEINPRVTENG